VIVETDSVVISQDGVYGIKAGSLVLENAATTIVVHVTDVNNALATRFVEETIAANVVIWTLKSNLFPSVFSGMGEMRCILFDTCMTLK